MEGYVGSDCQMGAAGFIFYLFLTMTKLVGGLEDFVFSHILGMIIPIDELIFFRGVGFNHQPVIIS